MLLALVIGLVGFHGVATANHRHNGSGTCWGSGLAWQYHYAGYDDYEWTVPSDWKTEISQAAAAWNAGHSNGGTILFRDSTWSNDIVVRNRGSDNGHIAVTFLAANSAGTALGEVDTVFNSYYPHKPNAGGTSWYDVQNTMTHEFGHWMSLVDIKTSGCGDATMWWQIAPGETKKQSLTSWDKNGLNWQYP